VLFDEKKAGPFDLTLPYSSSFSVIIGPLDGLERIAPSLLFEPILWLLEV
jgi:hypothetical protein